MKKKTKKKEFSKVLLIQESILIWIVTLTLLVLSFYCVLLGFMGSLPWISSIIISVWGAYGVSQGFYYNKSKKENTQGGIKYETTMATLLRNSQKQQYETYNEDYISTYSNVDNNPDTYQI